MVNLVGVWRLKSIAFVAQETGERLDFYGADPFGYMVFDPTDRMLVLMTAGGRTPAESASQMASLFQSMGAYTGRWSIDGEKLVTEVDGAWDPSWVGTEQIRYCTFDGHTLSLRSMPLEHPAFPGQQVIGVSDWQRES